MPHWRQQGQNDFVVSQEHNGVRISFQDSLGSRPRGATVTGDCVPRLGMGTLRIAEGQ